MTGNAWERCSDWYGRHYYSDSPAVNPQGPEIGSKRVYRGGSCYEEARACRVSHRSYENPDEGGSDLGFRVACISK